MQSAREQARASVTLVDVANAAGTSTSTVSRALSDPDKVNASTRRRIERIARDLGYSPNRVARSLSVGRTSTIGLIVPDIANPFFPPLIKAVQARAGAKNNAVLLTDTDEHASDEIPRARTLSRQVDGLIIASPRTPDNRLHEFLELGKVVFVNRQVDGAACVTIENADGIREAVEHLAALGHRSIAYLNGPRRSWSNRQRRNSMVAACKAFHVELVEYGPFEPQVEAGVRAADLVQAGESTAAVAYDDLIALGVMARLAERGLRVGQDMSVIGIDDSPMSGLAYPTLTSIHVPNAEAGRAAVDMLLGILDEDGTAESGTTTLETRLVIRGSTGQAPHI